MKKVFESFNEAYINERKINYPESAGDIITKLIGIGYKKYQLDVHIYQGTYLISLPSTGIKQKTLIELLEFMPEGSALGYYRNLGQSLMLDTNIKV